jgi:hypothetical protein
MMMRTCPREAEVKLLVERGQWPHAGPQELRAHVSTCRSCSEVALVTAAFQQARSQTMSEARAGSPGLLWWRAQLRRREAAVERISRPILGAQIFALMLTLIVAMAAVVWQARQGLAWLTWLEQIPHNLNTHWFTALSNSNLFGSDSMIGFILPAAGLAAIALVGGVVAYLSSEEH